MGISSKCLQSRIETTWGGRVISYWSTKSEWQEEGKQGVLFTISHNSEIIAIKLTYVQHCSILNSQITYFSYSTWPNGGTHAIEYFGCWMMSSRHEFVEDKTTDNRDNYYCNFSMRNFSGLLKLGRHNACPILTLFLKHWLLRASWIFIVSQ